MSTIKNLLSRNPIGLILRTFAPKPKQVSKRVAQIQETVETVLSMEIEGIPVVRRVDVIVIADKRFGLRADCGETAAALRAVKMPSQVIVSEFAHGDLFCGALNYAVAKQLRAGMDYSVILSSDARSYVTPETMRAVLQAAVEGAKAVGVAINELTQSVLEGRLANTFALWENDALVQVGGFDLRAAMPIDDKMAHYMRGWSSEKKEQSFYVLAGVEEVIPLARLTETFGPCIAPVMPRGEGLKAYEVPDPARDPEGWRRHISKMGTKLQRQTTLLAEVGYDIDYLKGGVMPGYRQF